MFDAKGNIAYTPSIVQKGLDQIVIYIIRTRATEQQLTDMLQMLGAYIKLAVDVQRRILAGGGAMHADCEAALLEDGSHIVQELLGGI